MGTDHEGAVRGDEGAIDDVPLPRPDGGLVLTAQSIDNNVVRTTVQALSAVLGGAQSLHTNARDEALALPTAEAARLALRTQQILAYESGVTETPDPLAGSYYVETADRRRSRRRRGSCWPKSTPSAARWPAIEARLPAAPDPGVGVPRPAGDRVGRAGRRGAQPVRGRRGRVSPPTPAHRSRRRTRARSRGSDAFAPSAIRPPGRPRWADWARPRGPARTSCRH